ncbi:MAG: RnfABCDGE type electron transport complex subunit D [Erysipelotrichaceae bacterium]|nr:RnfABCDGE type electron transport complex subunit D [Erysipelotrichaceae bacterium]
MANYKFRATPMFRQKLDTKNVMFRLTIGLVIVYIFGLWNSSRYGMEYFFHTLDMLAVSLVAGVGTEALYAYVLKKDVKEYLSTSFPWVTCLIITEIVPCDTSVYAIFVSTVLAIFFGKLVFGGFGQNTFNPAAVGRCFITTSFVSVASVDLIASATPAKAFASVNWLMTPETFDIFTNQYGGIWNLFFGQYHGALGETSALLLIAILIIFLKDGVVDNRVPLTFLTVCFVSAWIIGAINGLGIEYAIAFLSTGGLVYGGVFMLTDPVTSPFTVPGRMVFACIAAVVTCLIRFLGNLPEGMCYGILIANMLSPLIDKLFSCKQVDSYKRNSIITYVTIVLSIACIVLATSGLKPGEYKASEKSAVVYTIGNNANNL